MSYGKSVGKIFTVVRYFALISALIPIAACDVEPVKVKGNTILIYGKINQTIFEKTKAILAKKPHVDSVFIISDGGSVKAAIQIGLLIRSRGLSTYSAKCYSACVLAFIGGSSREYLFLGEGGGGFGFHEMSMKALPGLSELKAVRRSSSVYETVENYIVWMGGSRGIMKYFHYASPDSMYILHDPDKLCELNLITKWKDSETLGNTTIC